MSRVPHPNHPSSGMTRPVCGALSAKIQMQSGVPNLKFTLMLDQNVHWWRQGASQLAFPNLHERALLTARWVWEVWADATDDHRIKPLNGVLQVWHQLGKQRQLIAPPRRGESIGLIGEELSDLRPEVLGCVNTFHMMQASACVQAYLLYGGNKPLASFSVTEIAELGEWRSISFDWSRLQNSAGCSKPRLH